MASRGNDSQQPNGFKNKGGGPVHSFFFLWKVTRKFRKRKNFMRQHCVYTEIQCFLLRPPPLLWWNIGQHPRLGRVGPSRASALGAQCDRNLTEIWFNLTNQRGNLKGPPSERMESVMSRIWSLDVWRCAKLRCKPRRRRRRRLLRPPGSASAGILQEKRHVCASPVIQKSERWQLRLCCEAFVFVTCNSCSLTK